MMTLEEMKERALSGWELYLMAWQADIIGDPDGYLENFVGMPDDDFGFFLDCWLEEQQIERDGWFRADRITDPRYRQRYK